MYYRTSFDLYVRDRGALREHGFLDDYFYFSRARTPTVTPRVDI